MSYLRFLCVLCGAFCAPQLVHTIGEKRLSNVSERFGVLYRLEKVRTQDQIAYGTIIPAKAGMTMPCIYFTMYLEDENWRGSR